MATMTFDPVKYKVTTREQWQSAAEAWHRWGPTLERWLGPVTEQMLALVGAEEGKHILDVAAGAGGQTLAAAKRVGPTGYVLATDISPNILSFAEHDARKAGYRQVGIREIDGEALDSLNEGEFDAVISRVGLIYFPDQQKALKGMYQALKPGGKLGAIVYSTADKNQFFSLPVSIIRRRAQLPPPMPGQPGPFSLGGPGVLENVLTQAGFRNVETYLVNAPLRTPSAIDCLRFERESFGALHQMLSGLSEPEREAAWQEIEKALSQFDGPDGFSGPCEMIIGIGTR